MALRSSSALAALLLVALVGACSAEVSLTDHLKGWVDAAAAQVGWASSTQSGGAAAIRGRSMAETGSSPRTMVINGTPVPAWRGRLDTLFGLGYFAPALANNKCNPIRQNCNALPGQTYPYTQFPIDPTNPASGKPVLQTWYPAGSWSPSSKVPGGALVYAYPYKNKATQAADPFSTVGATLEYEVFFPADFDWNKGERVGVGPGLAGSTAF